jgi:hypothetical protein
LSYLYLCTDVTANYNNGNTGKSPILPPFYKISKPWPGFGPGAFAKATLLVPLILRMVLLLILFRSIPAKAPLFSAWIIHFGKTIKNIFQQTLIDIQLNVG